MTALSLTGTLWTNGTTVFDQAAFNTPAQRIQDWINSHAQGGVTVGSQTADRHADTHIDVSSAPPVNVASAQTATDLRTFIAQIATRITLIEGKGATVWSGGTTGAATTLKTIADAITNVTLPAASALTANTATAVAATGITGTVSIDKISQDHKVVASATVLTVTVKGGRWVNPVTMTPVAVNPIADANVALTTQPGAGLNRYDAIYRNADGSIGSTAGVASTFGSWTPYPTTAGTVGLAQVLVRNTSGGVVIPATDIFDDRIGGLVGGGSGSGGGSGGAPSTLDFVTLSDQSGTYTNSRSATALLGGTASVGNPYTLLKPRALDATLADALNGTASGSIYGSLDVAGAKATLVVPQGPIFLNFNGLQRIVSAALTTVAPSSGSGGASASGGAAVWFICADFGGTGPGFTITMSLSPGTNVFKLASVWFDGTSLIKDSIVYLVAPIWEGQQTRKNTLVTPTIIASATSGAANNNALGGVPGTAAITKYFSQPMRGSLFLSMGLTMYSSLLQIYVGMLVDGGVRGVQANFNDLAINGWGYRTFHYVLDGSDAIAAGSHTFQPYLYIVHASATVAVNQVLLWGEFWAL